MTINAFGSASWTIIFNCWTSDLVTTQYSTGRASSDYAPAPSRMVAPRSISAGMRWEMISDCALITSAVRMMLAPSSVLSATRPLTYRTMMAYKALGQPKTNPAARMTSLSVIK
jgi:hypothetical protein